MKSEPLPGWLVTEIVPPIESTRRFEMARPRPAPPCARVELPSACSNSSKMRSVSSGCSPGPVSATEKRIMSPFSACGPGHGQQHAAGVGELDRVAKQVEQHLPYAAGIGRNHLRHFGRDMAAEPDILGKSLCRQQLDHIVGDLARRHGLRFCVEPAGLDLGVVEQVLDQGEQGGGRSRDCADISALLRRQPGVGQQLRHAHDAVHRRADLVAHRGEEARLRLAGVFSALARVDKCRLRPLARGDVTGDRAMRDLICWPCRAPTTRSRRTSGFRSASGLRHRSSSSIRPRKRLHRARCRHRRRVA